MSEIEKTKADQINELHGQIMGAMKTTISLAVEAGRILTEVKQALPHGAFTDWIESNCAFDVRTAQRYRKAYENRDRLKSDSVSFLNQLTDEQSKDRPKAKPVDPVAAMFAWCPKVKASKQGIEILETLTPDEWEQLLETANLLNEDSKAWIVGDLLNHGLGDGAPTTLYTPGKHTIDLHCPQRWEKREVDVQSVPIADIHVDESIYPRKDTGVKWGSVKQYADVISHLPPVELYDDNTLIDGRMRLEAFKLRGCENIPAFYVDHADLEEISVLGSNGRTLLRLLAFTRNSAHGLRPTASEWDRLKHTDWFKAEYPESVSTEQ